MNGKEKCGFINDLRSYKSNRTTPQHLSKDYFNDGQKSLPRLEIAKIKKSHINQNTSSLRLSQPRQYPDPYQGVFYRPKIEVRASSQYKSYNF